MQQSVLASTALPSLRQLQLVNMAPVLLPRLPPMPALTRLHVAPAARECNHVLGSWLEAYPTLHTIRCTSLPKVHEAERIAPPASDEYPPMLQLPALRTMELFSAPVEVVPYLSNLRQLTSLTVSTTKVCAMPRSWSKLQSLRSLTTVKVKTDALPNAALSRMTALTSLSMEYCLTKVLADNLTAMRGLQHLALHDCKLVRGWPSQVRWTLTKDCTTSCVYTLTTSCMYTLTTSCMTSCCSSSQQPYSSLRSPR